MGSAAPILAPELPQAFRSAMRRLAATVGIVTARGPDGPVGMAATSIVSLTLEPPAVLVCVNRATSLHNCLVLDAPLSISILSRHQRDVSRAFGGAIPCERRFEFGRWLDDARGLPMLAEAQANLECTIASLTPYGTHSIVIANVSAVLVSELVAPLIYQDGDYL